MPCSWAVVSAVVRDARAGVNGVTNLVDWYGVSGAAFGDSVVSRPDLDLITTLVGVLWYGVGVSGAVRRCDSGSGVVAVILRGWVLAAITDANLVLISDDSKVLPFQRCVITLVSVYSYSSCWAAAFATFLAIR